MKRLSSRLAPFRIWFWPPSTLLRSLLRMPLSRPQPMPLPPVLSPPVPPVDEALPPRPPVECEDAWPPCDRDAWVVSVMAVLPSTTAVPMAAMPMMRMWTNPSLVLWPSLIRLGDRFITPDERGRAQLALFAQIRANAPLERHNLH